MSQLKKAGINPRDLTIRHSSKMDERISQFERAIGIVDTLNNNFANQASELMTIEMTEADKATFYIDVLGLTTDEKLVDADNEWGLKTRGLNTFNHLKELEKSSTNNSSNMADSAWESFNVITEYIDHAWVTTPTAQSTPSAPSLPSSAPAHEPRPRLGTPSPLASSLDLTRRIQDKIYHNHLVHTSVPNDPLLGGSWMGEGAGRVHQENFWGKRKWKKHES